MITQIFCMMNRHKPKRSTATWDGLHYISTCRYCGKHIRRIESGKWRAEWMDEGTG